MNLDEAINALQVHARQVEAIQAIAAAIKSVSDLDQMRAEREAALGSIKKRVEAAEAESDKRLSQLRARIEGEEKRLADVQSKIEKAEVDAAARAASNLAEAEGRQAALRTEANNLEKRLSALDEQIKACSASLAEINGAIDKARRMLSANA